MKGLLCCFTFLAFSLHVFGQDPVRCKQNVVPLSDQDIKNTETFEMSIRNFLLSNKRLEEINHTIPVVVHVVYNLQLHNISNAQIFSQIDVLNRDYNRANPDTGSTPSFFKSIAEASGIKFKLAVQDPNGLPTNGITRTFTETKAFSDNDFVKYTSKSGKDAWNTKEYLNIWVTNIQGTTLGYYPSDYVSTAGKSNDGVVIAYRAFGTMGPLTSAYNLGRTATHEVGHWLGLFHLWGPPSGSSCSSDSVNDTPVQPRDSNGCPKFPFVDSGPTCNNAPNGRNFSNFMDYTNDACMNMFSKGQVDRMKSVLATNRTEILSSKGLTQLFNKDLAIAFSFDTTNLCVVERNVWVRISNKGKDTINAYSFSISTDSSKYNYTWSGKLNPLDDTLWNLSEVKVSSDVKWITTEIFILPQIDELLDNNVDTLSLPCKVLPNGSAGKFTFYPAEAVIYPNPADDKLFIKAGSQDITSCVFYNLAGKEIFRTVMMPEINVSALAPGFYLVVLETRQKAVRQQLIVIR